MPILNPAPMTMVTGSLNRRRNKLPVLMFVSLQWKGLLVAIATIIGMSGASFFIHQSEFEQISADFQQQRLSTYNNQLNSLFVQQSEQQIQTLELLMAQLGAEDQTSDEVFEALSEREKELLITRGISNITVYSQTTRKHESGNRVYSPPQQLLENVLNNGLPASGIHCTDRCILFSIVPVFLHKDTAFVPDRERHLRTALWVQ